MMPADPSAAEQVPLRVVALIPVFNDWSAVGLLLPRLDRALAGRPLTVDVLLIDDGSLTPHTTALHFPPLDSIRQVAVLELKRNLGHQRAIAVGLAHVHEHLPCDAVLVMDGDGEDDPADAPRLLDEAQTRGGRQLVFAARARRSEGWLFRVCYRLFQVLHWLLTGYRQTPHRPRAGGNGFDNYVTTLRRVKTAPQTWIHRPHESNLGPPAQGRWGPGLQVLQFAPNSYFNPLIPRARAYRRLVDSNLDWGQELPGLKRWLDYHAVPREDAPVYLDYFGMGSPEHYGIQATRLPIRDPAAGPNPLRGGIYCISATALQSVYSPTAGRWNESFERVYQALAARAAGPRETSSPADQQLEALRPMFPDLQLARLMAFLRQREPDEEIGYSLLIYRLTDADITAALHGPPAELDPQSWFQREAMQRAR